MGLCRSFVGAEGGYRRMVMYSELAFDIDPVVGCQLMC